MKKITLLALPLFIALTQPALAISISFDYRLDTSGFFNDPLRCNVLSSAAAFYENRLTDSLAAITSSAGRSWKATFRHPFTGQVVSAFDLNLAPPS